MSFWTAAAGGTADLDIQAAQDLFDFTSDFVLLEMIHRLGELIFDHFFRQNNVKQIFQLFAYLRHYVYIEDLADMLEEQHLENCCLD